MRGAGWPRIKINVNAAPVPPAAAQAILAEWTACKGQQQFQASKGGLHAIALKYECYGGCWVAWVEQDDGDAAWAR